LQPFLNRLLGALAPVGVLEALVELVLGHREDHGHGAAVALDQNRLALGIVQSNRRLRPTLRAS
jgi:hypothetical protein